MLSASAHHTRLRTCSCIPNRAQSATRIGAVYSMSRPIPTGSRWIDTK